MDTEEFIGEILNRPALWMAQHPRHKLRHVIKRLWEEIKERFPDKSVDQLKKKWKNIKDTYRKELRKISARRSGDPGTGCDTPSNWKYFSLMTFMKEHMLPTEGNSNLIDLDDDLNVSSQSEVPSPGQSPQPGTTSPVPSPSGSQSPRPAQAEALLPSRKRTRANDIRAEYLEIEKKKLKILEDEAAKRYDTDLNIEKSDDYYYLMSILPEMKKLTPIQKMRLRNKINQALMDEMSMAMYDDPYVHRDTQPTSPCSTTFNNTDSETSVIIGY